MPTIEIQGVPHAYELTAPTPSGQTLVFIHGWLLSRHYWQPLIQELAPFYQCLIYDLRGFGHSQPYKVLGCHRPLGFARDLNLLIQSLNLSQIWLVGHSLGGSIALWGADLMPETVQGVICLNSGGGIYLKQEFERFRTAGQQMLKFRPRWLCQFPLLDLLFARMSVVSPITRQWGRQRLLDFVVAHPEAALGALLDSTTEAEVHQLPQVVARLQQPVYFITGDRDPIMEPRYVRHLASFHPLFYSEAGNVIELPHCGHLSLVEQPTAVAEQLQMILNRHLDARTALV